MADAEGELALQANRSSSSSSSSSSMAGLSWAGDLLRHPLLCCLHPTVQASPAAPLASLLWLLLLLPQLLPSSSRRRPRLSATS